MNRQLTKPQEDKVGLIALYYKKDVEKLELSRRKFCEQVALASMLSASKYQHFPFISVHSSLHMEDFFC